jgi:hypothetical protein
MSKTHHVIIKIKQKETSQDSVGDEFNINKNEVTLWMLKITWFDKAATTFSESNSDIFSINDF